MEKSAPVPYPDIDIDFLRTMLSNGMNQLRWASAPELPQWLKAAPLDGFRRPRGQRDRRPGDAGSAEVVGGNNLAEAESPGD